MKAEGYAKRRQPLGDWTIEIETYQLGDVFYCTINNVDPGARFARAEGPTREEAERQAPNEKKLHYLLGRLYTAKNQPDLAKKEFDLFSTLEKAEMEEQRKVK